MKEMHDVIELLVEMAQDGSLEPMRRVRCADAADSLGYLPEDLYEFIEIPFYQKFFIAKYPVTNIQYARFVDAPDFTNKEYWIDSPKLDENGKWRGETWGEECWNWLQNCLKRNGTDKLYPSKWETREFGKNRKGAPVVGIHWFEAMAYCKWLGSHWDEIEEGKQVSKPHIVKLPTREEWVFAAGGNIPEKRFPWDSLQNAEILDNEEEQAEIIARRRANFKWGRSCGTTPVWMFPEGVSKPYGLMDMAGNVWEWQADFYNAEEGFGGLAGGSWATDWINLQVSNSWTYLPEEWDHTYGFRIMFIPS